MTRVTRKTERNAWIVEQRQTGRTFASLARELGITSGRVEQVWAHETRRERLVKKGRLEALAHSIAAILPAMHAMRTAPTASNGRDIEVGLCVSWGSRRVRVWGHQPVVIRPQDVTA